uniref:Uncharacterized protein n=1 Tax=Arundo donax TaxID=35708 RepID=A0A0A9BF64_ARUDO
MDMNVRKHILAIMQFQVLQKKATLNSIDMATKEYS